MVTKSLLAPWLKFDRFKSTKVLILHSKILFIFKNTEEIMHFKKLTDLMEPVELYWCRPWKLWHFQTWGREWVIKLSIPKNIRHFWIEKIKNGVIDLLPYLLACCILYSRNFLEIDLRVLLVHFPHLYWFSHGIWISHGVSIYVWPPISWQQGRRLAQDEG